jgi:hypothetical protein
LGKLGGDVGSTSGDAQHSIISRNEQGCTCINCARNMRRVK